MFKSKIVGWITASTLLCVAGVAIACRLQEGSGRLAEGLPAAFASDTDDQTPPPAPPSPPAEEPQAIPIPEAPPTPVESTPPPLPEVTAVPPPPPPSVSVPVVTEKPEEVVTPLPTPPVETKVVIPPKPEVGEVPNEEVKVALPGLTPPAAPVEPSTTEVKPVNFPKAESIKETFITPVAPSKEFTATPATKVVVKATDLKNYWAVQGDTLRDVARKSLGSEDRWMELEKLNPELRARTLIPAGTLVRLPGAVEAPPAPMGGQAESEFVVPEPRSNVKPLPVIRSKPEFGKSETPLIGTFECKIDEKNGLVLPKEFREQFGFGNHVYLTPGPDNCLWLVSEKGEARVRQRVEKAAIDDDEVLAFRRLYFSQTRKVGVDAASRLTVPESLCEFGKFNGNVVIIGADDHFEVWDAARWQRYSQEKGTTSRILRGTED